MNSYQVSKCTVKLQYHMNAFNKQYLKQIVEQSIYNLK